ncbi:uncharacterized protein [Argopecten irradians]|uniref:uncharacterized protein isoform X2 n=1 Tax=Argopecten irradians TaxID=31199 RepID=UPI003710F6A3
MKKSNMTPAKVWNKVGKFVKKPFKVLGALSFCGAAQCRRDEYESSAPQKDLPYYPNRNFDQQHFYADNLKATKLTSLVEDKDIGKGIDSIDLQDVLHPGTDFASILLYDAYVPTYKPKFFRTRSIRSIKSITSAQLFGFDSCGNTASETLHTPNDNNVTDVEDDIGKFDTECQNQIQADTNTTDEERFTEVPDVNSVEEDHICEAQDALTSLEKSDCILQEVKTSALDKEETSVVQDITVISMRNSPVYHENMKESKEENVTAFSADEILLVEDTEDASTDSMGIDFARDALTVDVQEHSTNANSDAMYETLEKVQDEINTVKTETAITERTNGESHILDVSEKTLKVKVISKIKEDSITNSPMTTDQIETSGTDDKDKSYLTQMAMPNTSDHRTNWRKDVTFGELKTIKQHFLHIEDVDCYGANRVEMFDNQGHKTGICIPGPVNNIYDDKKYEKYKKATSRKKVPDELVEADNKSCFFVDVENNAEKDEMLDVHLDTTTNTTGDIDGNHVDSSNMELTIFKETMESDYPDKEVESLEYSYVDEETRVMTMVMSSKSTQRPTEEIERPTALFDNGPKTCNKEFSTQIAKPNAPANIVGMPSTLKYLLPICMLVNGADGARSHQEPDNNGYNPAQLLAFIDLLEHYVPRIVYLLGMYQLLRRNGLPICQRLRNLFENRAFLPPGGILLDVYNVRGFAIRPGAVGGTVARALPPRLDGIQVVPPGRRPNGTVQVHAPRNPVRMVRVLPPRMEQAVEESLLYFKKGRLS